MAAVKAKFPQAKEIDYCKIFDDFPGGSKSLRQQYREEDTNCVHLSIENYSVSSGVNYNLAFYFNRAGRIEQVILSKYFGEKDNPSYLTDCTALFDRTNTLLNINYGLGIVPSNASQFKSSYNNVATKIWVPFPTEINLKREWGFKLANSQNMPDLCYISLAYYKRGVDKL